MSMWEYKLIRKQLRAEGYSAPTEVQILNSVTQLREIVEESKSTTKKARRQSQRRKEHEKGISPAMPIPTAEVVIPQPSSDVFSINFDELEPYKDEDIS